MSIAAGRIPAGNSSAVHVHPASVQVTYVVAGRLTAKMKDAQNPQPYALEVPAGSAVVSQAGTLLQLCNETRKDVEVLYIVSPSYVFETAADGTVIHDDAVVVAEDWDSLTAADWDAYATEEAMLESRRQRSAALARMAARRAPP